MKFRLILISLFILLVSNAFAAELWTTDIDGVLKHDFSPNDIVYIHGNGFLQFSNVDLAILRPDGTTDFAVVISDEFGNIYTMYDKTLMVGNFTITAFDGINYAETTFTDAAIWTTKDDCGDSTQNVNQFEIGSTVYINGDGFSSGSYDWEIKGSPGGASCDPNIVVASGTEAVGASGAFCLSAYTVANDDCGVYQVKFSNKGDNYQVLGEESECGNSIIETGEECDDGNNEDGDGCDSICIIEYCGDEIVNNAEECDDGNTNNNDGCNSECILEYCGDGILNNGNEECDDGSNGDDTDGCYDDCTKTYCGDYIVQYPNGYDEYELCDSDSISCETTEGYSGFSDCSIDCLGYDSCESDEYCGDEIVNGNEECDDGLQGSETCSTQCTYMQDEYCGDEIVNGDEECDDGNEDNYDACSNSCITNYCGDSVVNNGEECDDGNTVEDDYCSNSCILPLCGDGIINDGETCDEGQLNGEVCTPEYGSFCEYCASECEPETVYGPFCGDEVLQEPNEECDDGNNEEGDGCSEICELEGYGSPVMPSAMLIMLFMALFVIGMRK